MKSLSVVSLVSLMLISNTVWAYGSSSSSKACAKPKFSEFVPSDKAEVSANTDFSFMASANTHPDSIKVSVKKVPVEITVEDKNGTAFLVKGRLPDTLKDTYARISIDADAANSCNGTGGWLVKIK